MFVLDHFYDFYNIYYIGHLCIGTCLYRYNIYLCTIYPIVDIKYFISTENRNSHSQKCHSVPITRRQNALYITIKIVSDPF